MRRHVWFWLTIVVAAVALVASAVLLVDYVRPAPVFCGAGGACAKVRATVFARPLGIPLPAIGLAGVLAVALASLVPGRTARVVQAALSLAGGSVAVGFLGVQARLGVLCPFCAVVDVSAVALAALGLVRLKTRWDPPSGRLVPGLVVAGLLLTIGVPVAVGARLRVLPGGPPAPIAEEMRRTPRGKVTVVDFVDFECPFCRMTHHEIAPVLAARASSVRLARKQVPLRMHPHALDAAKASCCADSMGKGEAMADALFGAPPEQLTAEGCEALAKAEGLDVARFRACVDDPATAARIERDREAFRASGGQGLPTIWIDGTMLEGAQDRASFEAALDSAIHAL
jgi:protein-disulfide isomerase/uncharacterized membrane protein